MEFTKETNELINKLYEGRKHVELTIEVLKNGKKEIVHFDENRNLFKNLYEKDVCFSVFAP